MFLPDTFSMGDAQFHVCVTQVVNLLRIPIEELVLDMLMTLVEVGMDQRLDLDTLAALCNRLKLRLSLPSPLHQTCNLSPFAALLISQNEPRTQPYSTAAALFPWPSDGCAHSLKVVSPFVKILRLGPFNQ